MNHVRLALCLCSVVPSSAFTHGPRPHHLALKGVRRAYTVLIERDTAKPGAADAEDDKPARGADYYQGMLQSSLDFRSEEDLDNVTPNLKLVLGSSTIILLLCALFVLSNPPPPEGFASTM